MERYVYTEKGEKRAKELGVEPRIAGQPAFFGHSPLSLHHNIAKAWEEKGYVRKLEDVKAVDS